MLEGLAELAHELGSATDTTGEHSLPPIVKIRPLREGSFIIEAILQWASQNPEGALSTAGGAGAGIAEAIRFLTKGHRARPKDFEPLPNGDIKVVWNDDTADVVPEWAWQALQQKRFGKRTKRQLRKIMAPLQDEATVLEIRTGSHEETTEEIERASPHVLLTKDDYRASAPDSDDTEERVREFTTEGQLLTVDFVSTDKWRIRTPAGTRRATMADQAFLAKVDEGLPLFKADIFSFRIREEFEHRPTRSKRTWTIIEVESHRRGVFEDEHGNQGESTQTATG